jgi:hypothetical protein
MSARPEGHAGVRRRAARSCGPRHGLRRQELPDAIEFCGLETPYSARVMFGDLPCRRTARSAANCRRGRRWQRPAGERKLAAPDAQRKALTLADLIDQWAKLHLSAKRRTTRRPRQARCVAHSRIIWISLPRPSIVPPSSVSSTGHPRTIGRRWRRQRPGTGARCMAGQSGAERCR